MAKVKLGTRKTPRGSPELKKAREYFSYSADICFCLRWLSLLVQLSALTTSWNIAEN